MSRPKLRKKESSKRKKERKAAQEALQETTSMFLNMPEECCACTAPFDKKSKEMAQTWHVVVFEEKKTIRLTCPPCWKKVENAATREKTNAS